MRREMGRGAMEARALAIEAGQLDVNVVAKFHHTTDRCILCHSQYDECLSRPRFSLTRETWLQNNLNPGSPCLDNPPGPAATSVRSLGFQLPELRVEALTQLLIADDPTRLDVGHSLRHGLEERLPLSHAIELARRHHDAGRTTVLRNHQGVFALGEVLEDARRASLELASMMAAVDGPLIARNLKPNFAERSLREAY